MDAAATVDALAGPISEIGRAWMLDDRTLVHGHRLGLSAEVAFDFWVNGRAGVLGEGDAAKVIAGIAFMDPALTRSFWEGRPAGLGAQQASQEYALAAANWGRVELSSMAEDELHELADLCHRLCGAAPASIGVLFAGWRELDLPTDAAGRATVAMNVVREMRGGAHISAIHAAGLDPVGAIISVDHPTHGGSRRAERFGWPSPHPQPNFAARERAEVLTSKILTPIVDQALSPQQRHRLVSLVGAARRTID